jgi:transposase
MSGYVGIDVHRERSQVAVVAEDGTVQVNKNVVNGSEPFLRLIGDLPSGTPVGFEAAFGWSWLADLLEDYGFEAHTVHPLRCKAIASARLKNDKVDAAILAQLLRADLRRGVDRPGAGPPAPRAAAAPDQRNAAAPVSGMAGLRRDPSVSDDVGTGRGDQARVVRLRVIGQISPRLGLTVTHPLDDRPDGRLGMALAGGWTARPGMPVAQRWRTRSDVPWCRCE